MTFWKNLKVSPRPFNTALLVGIPALSLGLFVGAAFALKRPTAEAGDGKVAAALEKLRGKAESALHLDRVKLSRAILEDETRRGNEDVLRVHLNQAIVLQSETEVREVSHETSADGIEEVAAQDIHRLRISPKAKGKVVAKSQDLKEIHVTFDRYCSTPDCALKFVAQSGRYVLAQVPQKQGFEQTSVYATLLGIRYQGGLLDEQSEGDALSNGRPKPLEEQVFLHVRKDTLTEVNVTRESAEGVE